MIGFTGAGLDRADALRIDDGALAQALAHGEARVLAMAGLDPVVSEDGRVVWDAVNGESHDRLILLGFDDGAPRFAPLVGDVPPAGAAWRIFGLLGQMDPRDAAIWGAARSLNEWHARHGFCGVCGSRSEVFRAGWGRRCTNCNAEHFPRVDPVVIMLAEYEGRVLLGRQPRYPPGRYSALAGFLEPGESIEEAVAREVMEEAGVAVSNVRYVASQPWPFPGSLMIGCIADAASDDITLDMNELEDAIWVGREGVEAALAGEPDAPFQAPPPFAIAHSLLKAWLAS